MCTHLVRLIAAALVVMCAIPAAAQVATPPPIAQAPTAVLVELRLRDGSVIYGTIQSETADRVVVRTIAGAVVDVERAQIGSLGPALGEVVNGEFRPADANATRLLFSPTGRSLRKGQGYVGVYEFLLPFVQYGVTDRFSLGAGTPLIFFGDESGRPVWLTPKYQFYKGSKTSAAVGVMHFVVFGEDTRAGLAYAVATIGTDDNALTAGAGWAYAQYKEDEFPSSCFGPGSMDRSVRAHARHRDSRRARSDDWRRTAREPPREGHHRELRVRRGGHPLGRRAIPWRAPVSGPRDLCAARQRRVHGRAHRQLRLDVWEVRPVAATGQSPVHLGWLIRSSVGHAILGAKEPADNRPTR